MGESNSTRDRFPHHDLHELSHMLASRQGGGFHLWDFMLGVLLTVAVTGFLYYRVRNTGLKALNRERQSFAVRALKDMDSSTLKKVLGQVNLPSWVNFPDFQRVGWLNSVMDQLWPRINTALSTMGRQQLDPLMKDSKPTWISSVQLDRFDLGDNAPQVTGVKVYQAEASGADEVLLELDFGWTSDAEMSMIVHPMPHQAWLATPVVEILSKLIVVKVGVEKVTLNGRVRMTLKPLMDEMPIVAAIQIAFVEMPNFNFDLTLYGGDIGFLPGLEAWITAVIKDSVLRPYVLPERYVIPLVPGDYNMIDRPRGMLFVTVVSAQNVPKMDWFNGSDPYVRLFVRDKRKLKTQVKENTTRPEWNEEFQLLVHEPEHQYLTMLMYDHDVLSVDDEIGHASFAIRNLRNGEEEEVDVEVKPQVTESSNEMMITKLVGKIDQGLDKVRSLTQVFGKKARHEGPCTLKLKLTYYEFAKEELETLDNGAPTTGSSFTTSSSDDLDSGQHLDRQTPQDSDDLENEQQQLAQQRDAAGLEPQPSGARQYRVHKQGSSGYPPETPRRSGAYPPGTPRRSGGYEGEPVSGARQYRVHKQGEPSARVAAGSVSQDPSGRGGRRSASYSPHRHRLHNSDDHSSRMRGSGSPGRDHRLSRSGWDHTQAHQDINGPQRQEDSFTEDKRRMQQGGANFGASHESDVQRSPEESMSERRNHSPHRHPNQAPHHPQGQPHPSENQTRTTGKRKKRKGAEQELEEPLSSLRRSKPRAATWNRPRLPSRTHERPVTPSRTFDRPREQDPKYQTLHTSAYQTPEEFQAATGDRQGQDSHGRKGGKGKSAEKSRGGETDSKGESRLQQSLQEQDAGQRTPRHANDRVMNILQGGLLYVEIRKASGLISKPPYLLGRPALPDLITVKVTVDGDTKYTAASKGRDASFDETLEFILGRKEIAGHEDLMVEIEVWDYRLINHFKGRLSIPFKEIARSKRMKDNFSLQGVRHGQLTLNLMWLGISDAK